MTKLSRCTALHYYRIQKMPRVLNLSGTIYYMNLTIIAMSRLFFHHELPDKWLCFSHSEVPLSLVHIG